LLAPLLPEPHTTYGVPLEMGKNRFCANVIVLVSRFSSKFISLAAERFAIHLHSRVYMRQKQRIPHQKSEIMTSCGNMVLSDFLFMNLIATNNNQNSWAKSASVYHRKCGSAMSARYQKLAVPVPIPTFTHFHLQLVQTERIFCTKPHVVFFFWVSEHVQAKKIWVYWWTRSVKKPGVRQMECVTDVELGH